jgi:hypothetical protein
MKVLTHLCSEDIIRDAETNSISVINVIEDINAEGFPAFIPKLAIFALIEKEAGDAETTEGQITLKNNDKVLFTFDIQFGFDGKPRTRNIVKFNGVAIPTPGKFITEFFASGRLISSKEINCTITNPPRTTSSS